MASMGAMVGMGVSSLTSGFEMSSSESSFGAERCAPS